jgi:hypothetical protein
MSSRRQEMSRREQLERELLATMCRHLKAVKAGGSINLSKELEKAFPAVPEYVRFLAEVEFESEELEAWWETLEKTIDGEILRRAIGKPE